LWYGLRHILVVSIVPNNGYKCKDTGYLHPPQIMNYKRLHPPIVEME
jgi:hypothetical protein